MECRICHAKEHREFYHGKIRLGAYGRLSETSYQLFQCNVCQTIELPAIIEDAKQYYQSDQYRLDVDQAAGVNNFYHAHDAEQLTHLDIVGIENIRGKTIADVGCGAGSFVDFASGVAKDVVAIEPCQSFQKELKKNYKHVYSYVNDAIGDFRSKIDLLTCFSTIEHIQDPLVFLSEMAELLTEQGELVLSTPNSNDILLSLLPEDYASFFFRKAHLWYFNEVSLKKLAQLAGFSKIELIPYQRFGLSNSLQWMRDKAPRGDKRLPFISHTLEQVWRLELEKQGLSDYLYMKLRK